jgi:hypothetical protein
MADHGINRGLNETGENPLASATALPGTVRTRCSPVAMVEHNSGRDSAARGSKP